MGGMSELGRGGAYAWTWRKGSIVSMVCAVYGIGRLFGWGMMLTESCQLRGRSRSRVSGRGISEV